ncbi:MAG: hypothetical protein JST30_04235 [Armatimonadetes bacterium]|nr:hypothetical protein [Armatimonadota bacterium]
MSDLRKLVKNIKDQVELAELDLQSEDAHATLRYRLQFVEEFARLGQQTLGPAEDSDVKAQTSANGQESPRQA